MKRILFLFILSFCVNYWIFAIDIDEARGLLLKERGGDILYLSRIILGIQGEDSWIAYRNDHLTWIYNVNDVKDVKKVDGISTAEISILRYVDSSWNSNIALEYNIMQNIPGTWIKNTTIKFGDYNGDGKDEIFNLYDSHNFCTIMGYDNDKGKMVLTFSCRFDITSSIEPAPVMFAKYKEKDGILVHVKDHLAERYAWWFFIWNEKNYEYEIIAEFWADEIDFSQFTIFKAEENKKEELEEPYQPVLETQKTDDLAATDEFAETHTVQKTAFTMGLGFYIGIGGIFVIAAAAVFILIRKKKRV